MIEAWVQYFGPPVTIIADLGPEFTGKDFQQKCDRHGIFVHFCDSKAPWQNARTERHGDLMKKMILKACYEYTPADLPAWLQMVTECGSAKNRLSNRSGYSPLQRVFGIAHRLPGDLASDDHVRCEVFRDLASSDPSFEEMRQIKEAACKAHASVSIRDRFTEAVQARWRRPLEPFKPDDVIIVWRVPVPSKGGKWVGPGVVIQTHHSTVWTSMRGSLWKCTAIQCKLAADDEARGLEIQNALLLDLRAELHDKRGRTSYVDVSRERPPDATEVGLDQPADPATSEA